MELGLGFAYRSVVVVGVGLKKVSSESDNLASIRPPRHKYRSLASSNTELGTLFKLEKSVFSLWLKEVAISFRNLWKTRRRLILPF